MMKPDYIAFDGKAGGEFAFGCVTGGIHLQPQATAGQSFKKDGSLRGEIRFHNGDDSIFKARRW